MCCYASSFTDVVVFSSFTDDAVFSFFADTAAFSSFTAFEAFSFFTLGAARLRLARLRGFSSVNASLPLIHPRLVYSSSSSSSSSIKSAISSSSSEAAFFFFAVFLFFATAFFAIVSAFPLEVTLPCDFHFEMGLSSLLSFDYNVNGRPYHKQAPEA